MINCLLLNNKKKRKILNNLKSKRYIINPSIHLSYPSIHLSIYPFICPIHPFICLSIHSFVYLSIKSFHYLVGSYRNALETTVSCTFNFNHLGGRERGCNNTNRHYHIIHTAGFMANLQKVEMMQKYY